MLTWSTRENSANANDRRTNHAVYILVRHRGRCAAFWIADRKRIAVHRCGRHALFDDGAQVMASWHRVGVRVKCIEPLSDVFGREGNITTIGAICLHSIIFPEHKFDCQCTVRFDGENADRCGPFCTLIPLLPPDGESETTDDETELDREYVLI
jgi:hypothetical protein